MNPLYPADLRHILCLGAHSDDIEIGCGGLMLSLLEANPGVQVTWVVFSAAGERRAEALESARKFLSGGAHDVRVLSFTDTRFPEERSGLKAQFQRLSAACEPDLILTHRGDDEHQDHRVIQELTWQTFRNHWALEYEIPKYEGDLGRPNVYVPLSAEAATRKVELLCSSFQTQQQKPWYGENTFRAVLALRGLECRSASGFAEGFYTPKTVFSPRPRPDRSGERGRRVQVKRQVRMPERSADRKGGL
ncbi:MAG: PIG-L family deacetylase [Rhodothermales bacterium]|nr:PIG-L family deacetylase [Rhodothermales bacterium]MBO6779567.1 PIG-L family deacetylase [Rhodothermales bacterium]